MEVAGTLGSLNGLDTNTHRDESTTLAPTRQNERVSLVDSFRGFALWGILLVNMNYMMWPLLYGYGHLNDYSALDSGAAWFVYLFAESKFYVIFSFLFGLGMAVQMQRCQETGRPFARFFGKRMMWLWLIGVCHAVFLWSGDILQFYGILGLALLLFRNRSQKALLIWAGLFFALFTGLSALAYGAMVWARNSEVASTLWVGAANQQAVLDQITGQGVITYQSGSFADIVGQRISELTLTYAQMPVMGLMIMIAFLLGTWTWRSGVLKNISAHRTFFLRILAYGLPIGLFGSFLHAIGRAYPVNGEERVLVVFAMFFSQFALGYSYLAALALMHERGWLKKMFSGLASTGRMALTNYLSHSVICGLIFYSYGLGLMGTFSPFKGLLLTIAICAAQIPLSKWWLSRFRFGPAEWLWRSLTYGKPQPMVSKQIATA